MPPLHSAQSVFSLRHTPSWLLLAFAAGSVNAIAFLACARFVTHVTGTITHVGIAAGEMAADYAIVMACFVAGAMCAAMLIDGRHHQSKRPLYAAPLLTVALLLAALAGFGAAGVFGDFGTPVEGTSGFVFLSILAFAMGLQNAAVGTSTGLLVRTTHMTGPATDLGVHLATAIHAKGETRLTAIRHAALRAGKIVAFGAGAAAGAGLASQVEYVAFLVPAVVVAGATALSFARLPEVSAQQPAPERVTSAE
jgi:uncharacterized membrane protein YoaK (UPF0700 family)